MNIIDIILIGFSLAMDAFAVSLSKGLELNKKSIKLSFKVAFFFGLFQSIMPLLGYLLSNNFYKYIEKIDHYIVFILLLFIGIKMIFDTFNESSVDNKLDIKTLLILSIAVSLDALAIGISFSIVNVNIILSITIIGIITFILSFIGMYFGSIFSKYIGIKSQIFGGLILIIIGFKILFEHLNII